MWHKKLEILTGLVCLFGSLIFIDPTNPQQALLNPELQIAYASIVDNLDNPDPNGLKIREGSIDAYGVHYDTIRKEIHFPTISFKVLKQTDTQIVLEVISRK